MNEDKNLLISVPTSLRQSVVDSNSPILPMDMVIWMYMREKSPLWNNLTNPYTVSQVAKGVGYERSWVSRSISRLHDGMFLIEVGRKGYHRVSQFNDPSEQWTLIPSEDRVIMKSDSQPKTQPMSQPKTETSKIVDNMPKYLQDVINNVKPKNI